MNAYVAVIRRKDGSLFPSMRSTHETSPFEVKQHALNCAAAFDNCELVEVKTVQTKPTRVVRRHAVEQTRD